jgi:hypothetical protein
MSDTKPATFEFLHIKCDSDDVQAVINHLQMFFWEVAGTNTIVSKESHLESGGIFDKDTIYSVTTEERFSTIDFKRDKSISNYAQLKEVETPYFNAVAELERIGCAASDNYSTPPRSRFDTLTYLFLLIWWIMPGIWYKRKKAEEHAMLVSKWQTLKPQLDSIVQANSQILNL